MDLSIGDIVFDEGQEEFEPQGPTPMPNLTELRPWDLNLLQRYQPAYAPICDLCCLCTYGKCNLAKGRTGACGIDIKTQQARIVEIACCIGAS
nr:acetyl-CoA decarbonylase/synthase complex subunit alpha [Candidatus Sigynarchaeota archaeon]